MLENKNLTQPTIEDKEYSAPEVNQVAVINTGDVDFDKFANNIATRATLYLRLHSQDNVLANPRAEEIIEAMNSALEKFNAQAPVTNIDMAFMQNSSNIGITGIYYKIVLYYIIFTQIADWVSTGQEYRIDELVSIDRLDRYQWLLEKLEDEIEKTLGKVKKANIKDLKPNSKGAYSTRHKGFSMGLSGRRRSSRHSSIIVYKKG